MPTVLYTAAHAVPSSETLPLGGGAAICRQLTQHWSADPRLKLHLLGPSILGPHSPTGQDIVRFSERQYAAFCRDFEQATTAHILRHDPAETVVLANDVSEGPDFARLARAGFPIVTIYHVDVVAYVTSIYGRGLVRPETTTRWWERLRSLPLPNLLRLVWDKQRASVRHSARLVLPSAGMGQIMSRCYPKFAPQKIEILPWGSTAPTPAPASAVDALRREFSIPHDAQVLLTLSRISPEKGQDLLLQALLQYENSPTFPATPIVLAICGEAAYMQGVRHLARLHQLAAQLKRIRVLFPGHVTGERKQAFFQLATLYLFPSRHESYGLTLLEAMHSGLAAVCLDHAGAREVMRPEFGQLVTGTDPIPGLAHAIHTLLSDQPRRHRAAHAAQQYAIEHSFSTAANRLAGLLCAVHATPRLP